LPRRKAVPRNDGARRHGIECARTCFLVRSTCDAAIRSKACAAADCRVAKRLLAMTARGCSIFIRGGSAAGRCVLRNDNEQGLLSSRQPENVLVFDRGLGERRNERTHAFVSRPALRHSPDCPAARPRCDRAVQSCYVHASVSARAIPSDCDNRRLYWRHQMDLPVPLPIGAYDSGRTLTGSPDCPLKPRFTK